MHKENKTAEQVIAEKIESAEKASVESNETLKSMASSITELTAGIKSLVEKSAPESNTAIDEIKAEMALIKAQSEAANAGSSFGSLPKATPEQIAKSKAFVEKFTSLIKNTKIQSNKSSTDIELSDFSDIFVSKSRLEIKSLNTFDNVSTGYKISNPRRAGDVEIVAQPLSRISPFVTNISAPANVIYNEFDTSYVDVYESTEYQAKTTGDVIKWGEKIIKQAQHSVKVPVTDSVLHLSAAGGYDIDPVARLLSAIEDKYDLKKDKEIVKDYIKAAQKTGTRVNKQVSATANTIVIKDILNTVAKLKPKYTNNLGSMRFLADVAVIDELFTQVGDDGHAMFEYFDYANKLAGLKTSRGVIEIVGVEGDFFKDYLRFDDNGAATTDVITTSYVIGGSNNGKVAGMFVDLNATYTLVSSPVSLLQVDNSFADQLTKGYVWAGKIGYFGGTVKLEEAVSLLIVNNT
jgi:HK97 family phage major capsid protein